MKARARQKAAEAADMWEKTESHLACILEVWREAAEEETEDWTAKAAEAMAKERSGGRGRREVALEISREMDKMRKRKREAEDWREERR